MTLTVNWRRKYRIFRVKLDSTTRHVAIICLSVTGQLPCPRELLTEMLVGKMFCAILENSAVHSIVNLVNDNLKCLVVNTQWHLITIIQKPKHIPKPFRANRSLGAQ